MHCANSRYVINFSVDRIWHNIYKWKSTEAVASPAGGRKSWSLFLHFSRSSSVLCKQSDSLTEPQPVQIMAPQRRRSLAITPWLPNTSSTSPLRMHFATSTSRRSSSSGSPIPFCPSSGQSKLPTWQYFFFFCPFFYFAFQNHTFFPCAGPTGPVLPLHTHSLMWMTLAALRSWQSTWPTLTRIRPPTSPTSGGRTTTLCGGPSSPTLCAHCARDCMTNPSRARLSIWRGGCGTRPIVRNKKVDLGKTCIKHSVSSSGCIPYVKKRQKQSRKKRGKSLFLPTFVLGQLFL